jgi:predicted ArsR family transcriptional regulator
MAGTRWSALAALVDPVRRALYEYVRRQDHPVTREEAADAARISRTLTAFHLDKLVDSGLLRARYEAPADKQRGRGRTPKVYEPVGDGLTLTVPPRQYELVGEILADAVADRSADAGAAAESYAFAHGRNIGASCQARPQDSTEPAAELTAAYAALTDLGFEPRTGDALTLGNCPFHALAQRQPALICGLNRAFVSGLLAGLGAESLDAQLRPLPGACCVRVAPTDAADAPTDVPIADRSPS